MQMSIPWTVFFADPLGNHVVKNVLGPSDLNNWTSKEVSGVLALDGTVLFLTRGHHENSSWGISK